MIEVESIIINDDVVSSKFCCDLSKCLGICCCLKGGRGAPIDDDEIPFLQQAFDKVKEFLPEQSLEVIKNEGIYEGNPGNYYITCVNDADCVFVYYDKGLAKCAIEKGFFEGIVTWRKPISCHLYPIRIIKFGGDVLRYSMINECNPAVKYGNKKNIFLIDFLKEPLTRKYGSDWYNNFKNYCDSINNE